MKKLLGERLLESGLIRERQLAQPDRDVDAFVHQTHQAVAHVQSKGEPWVLGRQSGQFRNDQIGHEFAAHQQYIAIAVFTLPPARLSSSRASRVRS